MSRHCFLKWVAAPDVDANPAGANMPEQLAR
ncbi:Uncharacterised protein [Mycobacteroides abscessus subsp. abscessus]|nr:Uncharacterised protein [Mycobacteroides abscessus subsp. abscessus]